MSEVAQRLAGVRARVAAACARAGRDASSVRIVAVSKWHDVARIREAYAAGQRELGENYVQELLAKAAQLQDLPDLRFRFIGHLQRNKAKDVVRVCSAVDGVDSIRLADALAARAQDAGRVLEVLVQVNVAAEPQKAGVSVADLPALLDAVARLDALRVRGLFVIPPQAGDPNESRPHFALARRLADTHGLPELSMGMSDDLEIAIEEGATMVRVGTAIFGPRVRDRGTLR